MNNSIGALVLAAGFSNRFGSIKLLAELKDGSTVFQRTLRNIGAAIDQSIVVTRPELEQSLSPYCAQLHVFADAERGMGATLGFGIQQIEDWDVVLVCLADMPFICSDSYRQIAAAAGRSKIVVPCYRDRPGNPVAFGADFFPALAQLSGDAGGREVMRANSTHRILLDLDDPALLQDIDTPADLARIQLQA
ncbi:MAG: nucleotidyltransferase family protein [Gammaproteobacteria bacterium]